jgi:predicted metal-dependent phosphoesterase TrpH
MTAMTTPRRNSVDLHTHTARSDGTLAPLDLYAQMRAWGSLVVAVTDHDTLAGVRELLAAGIGADATTGRWPGGPRVIAGVEVNTRIDPEVRALAETLDEMTELHVLGLGVDPHDAAFETLLATQREGRRGRIEQTLERLDALGLPVRDRLPEVDGGIDALGRPHVARALVAAGHADSVNDAFRRYLEPGAPAYVRRSGMDTQTALAAINAAGGLTSLAHSPWAPRERDVIDLLVDWGLAGLEVHYPGWDEDTIEAMARFARGRGLLATGGSDFHGDTGDYAALQAQVHVPEEIGDSLQAALAARRGSASLRQPALEAR